MSEADGRRKSVAFSLPDFWLGKAYYAVAEVDFPLVGVWHEAGGQTVEAVFREFGDSGVAEGLEVLGGAVGTEAEAFGKLGDA